MNALVDYSSEEEEEEGGDVGAREIKERKEKDRAGAIAAAAGQAKEVIVDVKGIAASGDSLQSGTPDGKQDICTGTENKKDKGKETQINIPISGPICDALSLLPEDVNNIFLQRLRNPECTRQLCRRYGIIEMVTCLPSIIFDPRKIATEEENYEAIAARQKVAEEKRVWERKSQLQTLSVTSVTQARAHTIPFIVGGVVVVGGGGGGRGGREGVGGGVGGGGREGGGGGGGDDRGARRDGGTGRATDRSSEMDEKAVKAALLAQSISRSIRKKGNNSDTGVLTDGGVIYKELAHGKRTGGAIEGVKDREAGTYPARKKRRSRWG